MNQSLQCNLVGHEGYPVSAICKNAKCKHPSYLCIKCLLELHKSHQADCILIESLSSQPQTSDLTHLRKQINAVFDELELILTTPQNVSQMTLSQLDQYGKHLRKQESESQIRGNLQAEMEKIINDIKKGLETLKLMMNNEKSMIIDISTTVKPQQNISEAPVVSTLNQQTIKKNRQLSHVFELVGEQSGSKIVSPTLIPMTDRYNLACSYELGGKPFGFSVKTIQLQPQSQSQVSYNQRPFSKHQGSLDNLNYQGSIEQINAYSNINSQQRPDSKNEPIGNNYVSSRKKQLENRIKNVISPQLRQPYQLNDQYRYGWPFNQNSQHQNIHSNNSYRQPQQKQG